ncbi:MAG: TRAP transporter substrate-binding protein DctP [Campylobacterales bacterium]|nr:TRAP transporter substrate-binding protein DctP [Campylobacterales bacterium]
MNRREFLISTSVAGGVVLIGGCQSENQKSVNIIKKEKIVLNLATSWPAHFPILGTAVDYFAKKIDELSGGALNIKIHAKNSLIPALEVFDATSRGLIDGFHSGPYYWKGKNSAFGLIGGFPFGFTQNEMSAYLMFGGGYELWRELYAKHNLMPFMGGGTDIQMGGWYKKPINSLHDLNGLKMRIPGIAGEVVSKVGVSPILLPAGEIYQALERGIIDATEWVGPALDLMMKFYQVAPYYYTGWHEPGSMLEFTFNKATFEKLPKEFQTMIEMTSHESHSRMVYEMQTKNSQSLEKLNEFKIEIKEYPLDVMNGVKKAFLDVIDEQCSKSGDFKKVWESCEKFLDINRKWTKIGLHNYLNIR